MDHLIQGHARFQKDIFPTQRALYGELAAKGQSPRALVISCSDSRVVPEFITAGVPGEVFVCRTAGNMVPAFDASADGTAATIEYAVAALGVRDVIVCGHTDCGAIKALLKPELLRDKPGVASWLDRCGCADNIIRSVARADRPEPEKLRLLAMENVAAQIANLRTHPCIAARLACGEIALHGWLFDIAGGRLFAMDDRTGAFHPVADGSTLPSAARCRQHRTMAAVAGEHA